MRKCLTLLIIMVFLLGMVKTPVFAAQISSVTAVIDSHKLVTVTGIIQFRCRSDGYIKITIQRPAGICRQRGQPWVGQL